MFQFDIITLFPDLIKPYFAESILKIALDKQAIKVNFWNPRDFSTNKHKNVDDTPYGGGAGMVLSPQPFYDCIMAVKQQNAAKVIYMSPRGETLSQRQSEAFSQSPEKGLIIVCGRYEGLDQRVIDLVVDQEVSIGNFVLSGGELPALVLVESVTRLLDNVLGNNESHQTDSFSEALEGKKQHPIYTKPEEFMGLKVPEVLKSGNHAEIEKWKKQNLK